MLKRVGLLVLSGALLAPPSVAPAQEREGAGYGQAGGEADFFPPQIPEYIDLDTPPDELLNRNVRILRTSNKAQLNRYVPVAYTFTQVNPYAVLRFLRRAVEAEAGTIFTFISPDGSSGKMLAMIPEYQIPSMTRLVETVNRPDLTSSSGSERIYRQLRHRRANVSFDPLLDDSPFIDNLGVYLTGDGSRVIVDPEQNALFIEDAPSGAEYLDTALAERLDVPTEQVLLNVNVYELAASNNARIGTDYVAWKNGPGAPLFAIGAFAERGRIDVRNGGDALLDGTNGFASLLPLGEDDFDNDGTNFAFRFETHSGFFDYLTVRGQAELLTSAKLAIINTRFAEIEAEDEVLYYAVQTNDPSGIRPAGEPFAANTGRNVVPTTNELIGEELVPVDVGLEFTVRPLIYQNGVDLWIGGTLSDYNGFDSNGRPLINSRAFETDVRMGEGQEIVLAGLQREENIDATNKAPILGSLPIIGYLFGQEQDRSIRKAVVITVFVESIVRNFDTDYIGTTPGESLLIEQANDAAPVELPDTRWGFDMWGLDPDLEAEAPAVAPGVEPAPAPGEPTVDL